MTSGRPNSTDCFCFGGFFGHFLSEVDAVDHAFLPETLSCLGSGDVTLSYSSSYFWPVFVGSSILQL